MKPLALALISLLAATPERQQSKPPRLFALVIGNNRAGDSSSADLKFADDDALALHQLLREAGARSVLLTRLDDQTQALHPEQPAVPPPTEGALNAAWKTLRAELALSEASGERTELLIFFSGHGDVSGGEGFLALEGGRLTRTALQALLVDSPARRNHVIVDACKSYFAVMGKGPGGNRSPYAASFAAGTAPAARSGFLLSSSSDGDSHEWERYQSGIFSFEVRSALRGSADADGDGRVTYGELGGFLSRANAGIANARFRPDFLVIPPGGAAEALDEAVLTWPAESSALLLEGEASHLYVENRMGDRVLEVNASANQSLSLHVPIERPLFVRSADERQERLLETLAPTQVSSLAVKSPQVSAKGAIHVAFSQLFARPFDAGAVSDFALEYALHQRVAVQPVRTDLRSTLRTASPFVALGATAAGLVAVGVGVERSSVTDQTSQQERVARNQGVAAANVSIGVAAGVLGAALGSWLVLSLTEPATQVELAVGPASVTLMGRW